MRHYILIRGIKVIEIIDEGSGIYVIDLINNRYINIDNVYTIKGALYEIEENQLASNILNKYTNERIDLLLSE